MTAEATPGRGQNGQYTRTANTAERDAEAARLRSRGLSYRQIAEQMGYSDASPARRAVKRALAAIVTEDAEELRKLELEKLDSYEQAALRVLETRHYTVSQGRLIRLTKESDPLEDDGPVLAALDRLVKIGESRRKLLGLDAPTRVRTEVAAAPVPEVDALIAQARERMAARN